jgi:TPR repeat protein
MKSALTALLAFCLCLPLVGDDAAKKKEFEETKAKAENGDALSQLILGQMYIEGYGVLKDPKEAARWWIKAAEQGNALAQFSLAKKYQGGKGVLQDHKEAVRWYRKAAEQGYGPAQLDLGEMYHSGLGTLEDYVTAYAWFNIAQANRGKRDVGALAKHRKNTISRTMTPEQIAKAEELLKEMVKKNPKLLNK